MNKTISLKDIPIIHALAHINKCSNNDTSWDYFLMLFDKDKDDRYKCVLDINPTYQRNHVWTERQEIDYIEYRLKGGLNSDVFVINRSVGPNETVIYSVIDGKQRITAIQKFINNQLSIFDGVYKKDITDWYKSNYASGMTIKYTDELPIKTCMEIYLILNGTGTQHTPQEIKKVRIMLGHKMIDSYDTNSIKGLTSFLTDSQINYTIKDEMVINAGDELAYPYKYEMTIEDIAIELLGSMNSKTNVFEIEQFWIQEWEDSYGNFNNMIDLL